MKIFGCIEEYLQKYAAISANRTAIIVKNNYTSYGELWRMVGGFSRYLVMEYGVKSGDRIVVKTMQTLNFAVVYFATHLSGAIFVPLEKTVSNDRAADVLQETDARVYISRDNFEGLSCGYIDLKKVLSFASEYFRDDWRYTFPAVEDSADIMFTTGTTGAAKGVEATHRVLLSTSENYIEGFELKDGAIIAVPGPLSHVNPLRKLYMTVMSGNTIVILDGLKDVKNFFRALDSQGVNALCLPPAALRLIWQLSDDKLAEYADQNAALW